MKKFLSKALSCLLVVGLTACSSGGSTTTATEGTDSGTDAGSTTTGGNLVIYSPNTDALINSVVDAFEAKYGITVEVITAGTGDCLTRIDSEKENPQADVMYGGMSPANYDKYPDLWESYVSPYDSSLDAEYQNYKGVINRYCLDGSAALLVNTDIFEELGLNPDDFDSYEDLLWPELQGRIAMGDPANSSSAWAELTNMLLVMGDEAYDEAAWGWVEQFIANLDGVMLDSSSAIYKGVSAGEYAVGVSYEDPCVSLLEDGATNLRLVYPSEGAVWLPAGAAIVKGAPNLDNAKLFIDFLQSDEGQQVIATTTARPVNTSITNTSEFMTPFADINVAYEDIPYCAEHKAEWQTRWTDLFTAN